MTRLSISPLWTSTIGFDRIFGEIEQLLNDTSTQTKQTYPPHNIIKLDDNKYVVELAVAGFNKKDITVQLVDGLLEIKGTKNPQEDSAVQYLHKGIGTREFLKTIRLADTTEVRGAEFKDGILRVALENIIPEHKKPRTIEIGEELNFYKPELLVEEKAA
jgi:molecular chaperone IbpA